MLNSVPLDGWRFRPLTSTDLPDDVAQAFAGDTGLPAKVPGNVHDDLMAAGLLADPYLGCNEKSAQWVGHQDWRYSTSLPTIPAGFERIDLVADGLDTAATVAIAGQPVARVCNQQRSYRWDITSLAAAGAPLEIDFESI